MKLHQLTNRIWYTEHDSTTDRPTLGYIMGDRRSVMLDAGNSGAHAELFLEAVRRAGLPRPELVCISHSHWDHTFGMASLGLPAIASEKTNALLLQMACWGWSEREMAKRLETGEESAFCDTHIRLEYHDLSRIQVRGADILPSAKTCAAVPCATTKIWRISAGWNRQAKCWLSAPACRK